MSGQSEAEQAKALGMATQEMEYRVDLFNRCRLLVDYKAGRTVFLGLSSRFP